MTDVQDYKTFIYGEVLNLKSQLEKRLLSPPPPRPGIDYERAFIKSLEHRIISLEKQLDDKQAIINKLLAEKLTLNSNTLGLHGSCSAIAKDNGAHSVDSKNTKPLAPPIKDHTAPSQTSATKYRNKQDQPSETKRIRSELLSKADLQNNGNEVLPNKKRFADTNGKSSN